MLFAVLGGLFLMHGLSGHGAMHHAGPADGAMVHAAGASGAATAHAGVAVAGEAIAGLPWVDVPPSGDGPPGQMAELCMAVLAGGLLLALLARRGGITAVARARRTHLSVVAIAFTGRLPDPPDLWRPSVCRC